MSYFSDNKGAKAKQASKLIEATNKAEMSSENEVSRAESLVKQSPNNVYNVYVNSAGIEARLTRFNDQLSDTCSVGAEPLLSTASLTPMTNTPTLNALLCLRLHSQYSNWWRIHLCISIFFFMHTYDDSHMMRILYLHFLSKQWNFHIHFYIPFSKW